MQRLLCFNYIITLSYSQVILLYSMRQSSEKPKNGVLSKRARHNYRIPCFAMIRQNKTTGRDPVSVLREQPYLANMDRQVPGANLQKEESPKTAVLSHSWGFIWLREKDFLYRGGVAALPLRKHCRAACLERSIRCCICSLTPLRSVRHRRRSARSPTSPLICSRLPRTRWGIF